jgi:hypothetical protein
MATRFPRVEVIANEDWPSPPIILLRAKGAGEGGIIPVAAALASFGPEPAVLPLTAPCVWSVMQRRAWQSDRRAAIRQSMSPRAIVHLDMSVINHRRAFRPQSLSRGMGNTKRLAYRVVTVQRPIAARLLRQ